MIKKIREKPSAVSETWIMLPMIHNSVQAVCYLIEIIEIASDGAEISKTVYNVGLFHFLNIWFSV